MNEKTRKRVLGVASVAIGILATPDTTEGLLVYGALLAVLILMVGLSMWGEPKRRKDGLTAEAAELSRKRCEGTVGRKEESSEEVSRHSRMTAQGFRQSAAVREAVL
jgi:hypothetical protein